MKSGLGLVAFLLPTMLWTAAYGGEETPVELSAVPANLIEIAKERIPGFKPVSANTEKEDDGSSVYEIQGMLKDGRKAEIDIFKDGKIQEIEIAFRLDDVPGAVLKAIQKKLPGFKPHFIEASHSRSMKVVRYEFVGKIGDAEMDIEVSADGRRVVVADK